MNNRDPLALCVAVGFAFLSSTSSTRSDEKPTKPTFPSFRMKEIETKLGIGYAVLLADINGDGKKDIVGAPGKNYGSACNAHGCRVYAIV